MILVRDRRPRAKASLSEAARQLLRILLPEPAGAGWSIGRLYYGLPWTLVADADGAKLLRRRLPQGSEGAMRELIRDQLLIPRPGQPDRLALVERRAKDRLWEEAVRKVPAPMASDARGLGGRAGSRRA